MGKLSNLGRSKKQRFFHPKISDFLSTQSSTDIENALSAYKQIIKVNSLDDFDNVIEEIISKSKIKDFLEEDYACNIRIRTRIKKRKAELGPQKYYAFLSQYDENTDGTVSVLFELTPADWIEDHLFQNIEDHLFQNKENMTDKLIEEYFKNYPVKEKIPVQVFHIENTSIEALKTLLSIQDGKETITEGNWYQFSLSKDSAAGIEGQLYSEDEVINS